jgi:hypothetical protein
MGSLLTHRNQIREPIHHNSQANINSSSISKLRIDILSKPVPNFNFNFNLILNRKRMIALPSLISILRLTVAIILILVLIIAMPIIVRRKMDHRIIINQDFRISIRPSITLHQIFSQNLSSQMLIRRSRRIRIYHACRQQHRLTVIRDAVVRKDQPQGCKLLANQLVHRDDLPQMHRRSKADCSKSPWSTLSFVDSVIA